jgi:hypothetical protein
MRKNLVKKPIHTFKTKDYRSFMFIGVGNDLQPSTSIYFGEADLLVMFAKLYLTDKQTFNTLSKTIDKAKVQASKYEQNIDKQINNKNEMIDKLHDEGYKVVIAGNKTYKIG